MERADAGAVTRPSWVSAFLDLAPAAWECGIAFWAQASGTSVSPLRGDDREFGSLLPASGDDHLRVQPDDHVILFLVDKSRIRDVEKLFQVGLTFF